MMAARSPHILLKIERPVLQNQDVDIRAGRKPASSPDNLMDEFYEKISWQCRFRSLIIQTIPALSWLTNYRWHDDLIKDVIAGCTVAVMNIPQGMAYAILANVPPVVGIYMAFFPVIVYAFLGTSRHVSMGSFAVVCLMTGKIVLEYSGSYPAMPFSNSLPNDTTSPLAGYTAIEVATSVSFAVGIFQIIMYLCRLGVICALLSDTLVSGFTAGAAIHVFTSQIKNVFGFTTGGSRSGLFSNVKTYIDIFNNISYINWAATVLSVITMLVLISNNILVKPWVKKRCIFPIPIELFVIVVSTIISRVYNISQLYGLKIVGEIPVGLPDFTSPTVDLFPMIATDSLIIAVIAYISTISMALIFAQQHKYEIDTNQELLAQGAGNLVGSFFSCAPFAASLSRSVIQETVGGKTQLASLISSCVLLSVLLWIGPFFQPLPRCVLSSLIIVALETVLMQVTKLPQIFRLSVLDGMVWIVTYLTVVFVDIDVGLLVGLCVSLLSLLIQGLKPYITLLSRVPGTDVYVDKLKYSEGIDKPGIKIVKYSGGVNFANLQYFKHGMHKLLGLHPSDMDKSKSNDNKIYPAKPIDKITHVILDISGIHYVDPSGANMIKTVVKSFHDINIPLYIAGTSEPVHEAFRRNGLLESKIFTFFPTIHDAVLYAQYVSTIAP